MAASDELKNILKMHTKTLKKPPVSVFIKIREVKVKKVEDLKIKDISEGLIELRIHTSDEKLPKWFTYGYLVEVSKLRLNVKEIKKMKEDDLLDILNTPNRLVDADTKSLFTKFQKDFGGVIKDVNKFHWKTEKFKKQRDPFKVKMKAM